MKYSAAKQGPSTCEGGASQNLVLGILPAVDARMWSECIPNPKASDGAEQSG